MLQETFISARSGESKLFQARVVRVTSWGGLDFRNAVLTYTTSHYPSSQGV